MAQAELRDTSRRVENILADLAVLRAAGELYVLAQPSALDDLRLDDGQRARVEELSARAGKRWMGLFRLSPPASRWRSGAGRPSSWRGQQREIEAILTPGAAVSPRQIALQSEGPGAFREPEVVAALGSPPGGATGCGRSRNRRSSPGSAAGRLRTSMPPTPTRRTAPIAGSRPCSPRSRRDGGTG